MTVVTYTHNSYLTVIGVHEMHGRMHPNYCQITILLVVDLCSSLAYFMMTQPLPIASKLSIKTLVAGQLPINICTHMHTNTTKLYWSIHCSYTHSMSCEHTHTCTRPQEHNKYTAHTIFVANTVCMYTL